MSGRRAEFREQLAQASLADAGRSDHGREITAEVTRVANVKHDHLVDILSPLPLLIEHKWRDADALLEDFGCAGIVGSVRSATDIALVRSIDRPEHHAAAIEYGNEHRQVREMIATVIRIVQQIDVTRSDRALEKLAD